MNLLPVVILEKWGIAMKFKYVVYQDGEYYVSQCLNVDVSSFGKSVAEAVKYLEDAMELYLRDDL
jgi:predicted RNase H-like HicB family nuclease